MPNEQTSKPVVDLESIQAVPQSQATGLTFEPLSVQQLTEILGLTIKKDEANKVATFLAELSAYTEDSQLNVSFNAPSSTGKSFIPTEIARLFPSEDVKEVGYISPTAFFHDHGALDTEKNQYVVDLAHKVLIFLDQPGSQLLKYLRPFLSHDKKEIMVKITDKKGRNGLQTKNILIVGYPSVVFCTATQKVDEQEATRFLLLSPEMNQEKIREGIRQTIRKEANGDEFTAWLGESVERKLLQERIVAIKDAGIESIHIPNPAAMEERFAAQHKILKPRHQRDIKRLLAIIKTLALLNLWWREREGSTIMASQVDIDEGFALWDQLSASQELNLSPYVYNMYLEVFVPAWLESNPLPPSDAEEFGIENGLERKDIFKKHLQVHDASLDVNQLRHNILPALEDAGLIALEKDSQGDKRKTLIYLPPNDILTRAYTNNGAASKDLAAIPF